MLVSIPSYSTNFKTFEPRRHRATENLKTQCLHVSVVSFQCVTLSAAKGLYHDKRDSSPLGFDCLRLNHQRLRMTLPMTKRPAQCLYGASSALNVIILICAYLALSCARERNLRPFDFDRAYLVLGYLRNRIHRFTRQRICWDFHKVKVHEHHAARKFIREAGFAGHLTAT